MLELLPTLALLAVVGIAYAVRARTLGRAGAPVAAHRIALFGAGLAALMVALTPPLATLGEEDLLSAHMAQHLLLVDVAPALLLAGLTGPLLRPLLAAAPGWSRRPIAHPWLTLPAAFALLVLWHVPALFDAAVRFGPVHLLEHASFFVVGLLFWLPLLETLPAPARFGAGAKLAYVVLWRTGLTVLGNVLLWAPAPLYGVYGTSSEALDDQRFAAALMMGEGMVVFLGLAVWLGLGLLREAERRQRMLERGFTYVVAARAARYGHDRTR